MRIIAGRFRGRALTPLGKGDAGAHLRPTPDRVRESLFSILAARGVVDGARVLDLFAGTGALGLEALSRGADHVTFVENGRTGASLIQRNAKLLGVADSTHLLRMDATKLGANTAQPADLVFLDPPYGKGLGARALTAALTAKWIAPEALIVWEENAPQTAPDGFDLVDTRRFGDTTLTLITAR
ncbi:16S rRNA (guanine(966)-N(2))-methyltransferase RsmD [Arenibacterium halophilum]|uniref:16S rRNA (Guanine(966)-N(2))-methyltransferase RsmD n=1 Tax=Arenibacterium halophilum TaxID=2583821 RepID=A0ABY2XF03_9RHOB|nr:16S rRNA (guanine(966)-N(2))-methyltransferase RsmD [Arenibacterium halophilum]TMV15607.1 16S rRNA (guanine(966)-N(2))-methyltransferase RsmD [Arenibacterium halophilum]